LLPDVSEGFFFDIGANDGINISNTYYFEKVLNWTGIAIEPLPRAYKQLLVNRRCFKVTGCVTDYDGETRFLEIDVVSVENNYFGSTIEEFMADSGYDLVAIGGVDETYRKRNRRIAMLPRQMAA
jgi:hypothetical protein